MTIVIYDGTWFGFLSAVFEVYEFKLSPVSIESSARYQIRAFTVSRTCYSDELKALRVWNGLKKRLSSTACRNIYLCFLSEIVGMEDVLLQFIQLAFSVNEVEKAYGNPVVLKVSQLAKSVYREKHRMEAFVRFKLTKDNIYFATIEPDFNVIPVIVKHFEKRYADQQWLIFDTKRRYGIYYNLHSVEEVMMEFKEEKESGSSNSIFSADEELYQKLWRDYFKHVNIVERKNTRLHIQHVPKRYWKYLIEKRIS